MEAPDPITQVESHIVLVDGIRVHYQRAGSGPPLIMIHGLVGSARNWDENINVLAAIRTVYAPDAVNMGDSERRADVDPGMLAQVARVIAWMDALGIAAADFVGHSHGSAILIVLAARHPDRVRKLALFCPPNSYCDLGLPQVRFYSTFFGGIFARRVVPLLPRFMWRRSAARIYGDRSRMTEAAFQGTIAGLDYPAIAHIVDVMRGWQTDMDLLEAALPALDPARTALFWGDLDRAVAIDSGRKLSAMLGWPLIVIEGTGHLPFLELPGVTNTALLTWLEPVSGMTGVLSRLTVLVDGVRIHYERAGSGPALLLVHGLVGAASNWVENIADWAEVRTVYAIDQVNMGKSQRITGLDAGLAASADRIATFLNALGIAVADIAGHSHGGAVVMMLAIRYPQRVRKLVLFAPANPFCLRRLRLIRFYGTPLGRTFARLIPKMPRLVHDLAHRRLYSDQSKVTRLALDGYSDGLNPDAIKHLLRILASWRDDMVQLQSGLRSLRQFQTLLVWGERDGAVGVRSGRQLAQAIGADLLVIRGTGHLPFQEKPAECNAAVRRWLQ